MAHLKAATCPAQISPIHQAVFRTGDAIDRVVEPARALRAIGDLMHPTHVGTLDFSLVLREDLAWLISIVHEELMRKLEEAQECSDNARQLCKGDLK